MSVNEKMTAIADAIRDKTGGSEVLSLDNMAEEIPNVYAAGEQAGRDAEWNEFWDIFQENGSRVQYEYAFRFKTWNANTFKPKYDIKPTSMREMFRCFNQGNPPIDMAELTEQLGITLDFSKIRNASVYMAFASASVSRWGTIDISNGVENHYAFYGGYAADHLTTIEKFIVNENTAFSGNMFGYLGKLEKIIFEGVIAKNGLSITSNKLSHESLMSIINCLKDYSEDTSGTVWKVTIGSTNLAKLTDDEIEIASGKGWQLV